MKKRILALVCATVMVLAMGMTVCAAPSVGAADVAPSQITTPSQDLDYETVSNMVANTTVTSSVAATFNAVGMETVADAVAYAQETVGKNALIVTVFDLHVPAGTGAASFTVGCNVKAGQNVVVLHEKADGTWETIKPTSVANGSVTFTMTSYSPVAIVANGTASKTADMAGVAAVMAMVSLAGTAVCSKKAKKN